jgi:hypothetical protein
MDLESIIALNQKKEYLPMSAIGFDSSSAYGVGEYIAKEVGYDRRIDFYAVVKSFGGTLHFIGPSEFKKLGQVFENSIYVQKDYKFDVLLPIYHGPTEHRYTLAHEIGHFIMHKKPMSYACRGGDSPVEQEANSFALGLLMPAERFKEVYEQIRNRSNNLIFDLSGLFSVPEFAVEARLESLGYSK